MAKPASAFDEAPTRNRSPEIESEPGRVAADPVIASEAPPAIPIDREEDTLVRGALDAYREGRLEKAWEDLDRAAQLDPERLDLRAYQELIRNQLMGQWAREIGDQGRIARLKVELNDLMGRDLQPDEGFSLMIDLKRPGEPLTIE